MELDATQRGQSVEKFLERFGPYQSLCRNSSSELLCPIRLVTFGASSPKPTRLGSLKACPVNYGDNRRSARPGRVPGRIGMPHNARLSLYCRDRVVVQRRSRSHPPPPPRSFPRPLTPNTFQTPPC